jgi:hypothetical protein
MLFFDDTTMAAATPEELRRARKDAETIMQRLQGVFFAAVLARKPSDGAGIMRMVALFNDAHDAPTFIHEPLFAAIEAIGDAAGVEKHARPIAEIEPRVETIYNLLAERRVAYVGELMRRGEPFESRPSSKWLF